MELTLQDRPEIPRSREWRAQIGLCFFAFILIGCSDGATGVLLPSLMRQYQVDKATISLMFLAGTAGYLTAALNSGLLVARLGRRRFLGLGAGVFALGAAVLTLQPPFLVFLLALFCIGLGIAVIDAGLNAYIGGLPGSTAVLNYLHAFYGAGALLGPVIASGLLAVGLPWNATYSLWLVMGLILLAGFSRLFDNSRPPAGHAGEGNLLAAALRLRVVWLAAAFLFVYVGAEAGLGSWGYSFLTEERHTAALLSAWTISGYWLGLTIGRLVLGRLAARLGDRRTIEICLAGVAAGVLLTWLVPAGPVAAAGLLLTGFSLGPVFPTVIALVSRIVPPRVQPSAIGFIASSSSMGGAFFPWTMGNLAQAAGLWTLLPYVAALTAVMLGLWFALNQGHGEPEVAAGAAG